MYKENKITQCHILIIQFCGIFNQKSGTHNVNKEHRVPITQSLATIVMKTFVDPEENFIVKVPMEWFFATSQHNGDKTRQPFGFEPYDERNAALQISCRKVEPNIHVSVPIQPREKSDLTFQVIEIPGLLSRIAKIEGGFTVLITLTYEEGIDDKQKNSLFKLAERSAQSFMFLDQETKAKILPKVRWDSFMLSYVASRDLSNRAFENGSNIELVILLANQIDAVLRQSIILNQQIQNKNNDIEISLIFQKESDRPIMEKTVYQRALNAGLISQSQFDKLYRLYGERNKVVHRYIISDLRTDEIVRLVIEYSEIYDELSDKLIEFEQKQYKEQIGIYSGDTRPGENIDSDSMKSLVAHIRDKHGNRTINEGITFGKNQQQ